MSKIAVVANFVLVLTAVFLPRMIAKREDGLAGAATVALSVLGTLGLALLIGIIATVSAWRTAKKTDVPMPISAYAPLGVFLLGILGLFVLSQINLQ
jgi:hypothetical protein